MAQQRGWMAEPTTEDVTTGRGCGCSTMPRHQDQQRNSDSAPTLQRIKSNEVSLPQKILPYRNTPNPKVAPRTPRLHLLRCFIRRARAQTHIPSADGGDSGVVKRHPSRNTLILEWKCHLPARQLLAFPPRYPSAMSWEMRNSTRNDSLDGQQNNAVHRSECRS